MSRCLALSNISQSLRQGVFHFAFLVALPNAAVAAALKALDNYGGPWGLEDFLPRVLDPSAFSSFTFLIGVFIAFRASQAYSRFWDGADASFQMVADFFDVASSLCSFCRFSKQDKAVVQDFKHTLIRLFSMLHALILAELEAEGRVAGTETALELEILDLNGLDEQSLTLVRESEEKVDLVYHWIQLLIVQSLHKEIISVPAPIATRAFQELNAGMVQFHQALKITEVAIPFPYTAATEVMLIIHWLLTPIVCGAWTSHIWGAAALTFVQAFMVWSLNCLTTELENPFGNDQNDLNRHAMHTELNSRLLLLLEDHALHIPQLSDEVVRDSRRMSSSLNPVKVVYSIFDMDSGNFTGRPSYRSSRLSDMTPQIQRETSHRLTTMRSVSVRPSNSVAYQPEKVVREANVLEVAPQEVQSVESGNRQSGCLFTACRV